MVDDEAHIRTSLSVVLRDAGYRVDHCSRRLGSARGLSSARKSSEPIDLILTDVSMPGLDGLQLNDEIGRVQLEVPIMIITEHKSDQLTAELTRRGCFDLIEKPYDPFDLVDRIRALLRNQHVPEA